MKLLINKKGEDILSEPVIFLILNLVFFLALLFFVVRSGSDYAVVEETYAKKIALVIDNMKSGMEATISLKSLYDAMNENKFRDFPIKIENNIVNVRAGKGSGYNFLFFSDVKPTIDITTEDKLLTIKT